MPITVGDIAFGATWAVAGPMAFVVGLLFVVGWAARKLSAKAGLRFETVVVPARHD
jgi:hypothetical protein